MTRSRERSRGDVLALIALVLPFFAAWIYFVGLKGSPLARFVYLAAKAVQFGLPLLWLLLQAKAPHRDPPAPWSRGLGTGIVLGLAAALTIVSVHTLWISGSALAPTMGLRIGEALVDFRIQSASGYLVMALALSVVHSLLEELYWRWFVFQRTATWLPVPAAITVASLGFAAHHWIVINRYLPPDQAFTLGLAATLAVAGGGAAWCWLYRRSGNLIAVWISHMLVDFALLGVGYLLWRG